MIVQNRLLFYFYRPANSSSNTNSSKKGNDKADASAGGGDAAGGECKLFVNVENHEMLLIIPLQNELSVGFDGITLPYLPYIWLSCRY